MAFRIVMVVVCLTVAWLAFITTCFFLDVPVLVSALLSTLGLWFGAKHLAPWIQAADDEPDEGAKK